MPVPDPDAPNTAEVDDDDDDNDVTRIIPSLGEKSAAKKRRMNERTPAIIYVLEKVKKKTIINLIYCKIKFELN